MPKAKLATPNTWRPRFQLGVDALICFQLGIAKNAPSFIQRPPIWNSTIIQTAGVGQLAGWPTLGFGQPANRTCQFSYASPGWQIQRPAARLTLGRKVERRVVRTGLGPPTLPLEAFQQGACSTPANARRLDDPVFWLAWCAADGVGELFDITLLGSGCERVGDYEIAHAWKFRSQRKRKLFGVTALEAFQAQQARVPVARD